MVMVMSATVKSCAATCRFRTARRRSAERVAAQRFGPDARVAGRPKHLWVHVVAAAPDCHRCVFYDNSTDDGLTEVASFRYGLADYPARWPRWAADSLLVQ